MRRLRGITKARLLTAPLTAGAVAAAIAGCGGSHDGDPGAASATAATVATHTARAGHAAMHTTVATGSNAGTPTPGAAASAPHPDLGPFAGYGWTVDVRSVHADWTVPHLTARSPAGQAAAWVGAEAPGASGRAPFIQVGVHEGDTGGPPSATPDFYYAFYSTTTRDFRPVPLFVVQPGDAVSATLRRIGRRWRIEIDDFSSGRSRTVSSAEGAGRSFNDAQVNQEDVTDSRTGRPYPYPSLSALRFSHVSVNGGAPARGRLDSSWLTEADGYLAPAPLHGGAFSLAHARMSAAAYRYLREIAGQDAATTSEITALGRWATGGPSAPARAAARRLAAVLRRTESRLRSARWPPGARWPISALCGDARRLVSLLAAFRDVPAARAPWAERFYSLAAALGHEGRAARAALRLPSAAVLPAR
jgi:hypothetical protein